MNSQSASAFIEQIKTEYRAVVEAEKSALPHAIKCGEYLKLVTNSTDPAVVLQGTDAGEIIANIQDDADKLEEVAKASIVKLTPDKVCDALTQAWDVEQLRDLAKRLSAHLNTQRSAGLGHPTHASTISGNGEATPPSIEELTEVIQAWSFQNEYCLEHYVIGFAISDCSGPCPFEVAA
jgi:hypothetical protein